GHLDRYLPHQGPDCRRRSSHQRADHGHAADHRQADDGTHDGPERLMIDFDKYTLGELAKIEELTGLSIPDLMRPGAPQMKKTAAVCFVEAKRQGLNHSW